MALEGKGEDNGAAASRRGPGSGEGRPGRPGAEEFSRTAGRPGPIFPSARPFTYMYIRWIFSISRPRAHQEGIPLSGRPAQTVVTKASGVGMVPPSRRETMSAGAKELPTAYSP